ncbi:MAG: hypothetical protein AAGN46_05990 [Acidobacteriota bacterium]
MWPHRRLAAFLLLGALLAGPLAALSVEVSRACDAACCPLEGPGACCCALRVAFWNADGTPRAATAVSTPTVRRDGGSCSAALGTLSATSIQDASSPLAGTFGAVSDDGAETLTLDLEPAAAPALAPPLRPRPPPAFAT